MKVLQVVHGFPPESIAGTERYCASVIQRLSARGHECVVLAGSGYDAPTATLAVSEEDGLLTARYRRAAGRPQRWTEEYDPDAERLVRRLLKLMNPDVVHLHHWLHLTNNLVAICADLEIPVVVTLHDAWATCPRIHRIRRDSVFCIESPGTAPCLTCVERTPWQGDQEIIRTLALRQEIIGYELDLAATIIVPSEAHRTFLLTLLDLPEERLVVLPHGYIATDVGHHRRGGQSGFPGRPLQIGHWGYLMSLKGTHLILEAVQRLRDPSKVHVHLIGNIVEPEYEHRLRDLSRDISVQFHGAYRPTDLQAFDFDLAIFASVASESYSFALDEALGLGLPVIVSDRGALPDRIGRAGLTFRAGDPDDLTRRLQEILDAPQVLEAMRRHVQPERLFSMESHVAMLEKTYEDAAHTAQPTRESGTPYLKLIAHTQQQVQEREGALAEFQLRVAQSDRISEETEAALQQAQQALTEQSARLQQAEQALLEKEGSLKQAQHVLEELQARFAQSQQMFDEKEMSLQQAQQALTEQSARLQQAEQAVVALQEEMAQLRRHPLFKLQAILTTRHDSKRVR